MTTKAGAIYNFLSGFGIPAYPSTSVPDDAQLPYITYDFIDGAYGDVVHMLVNMWFRTFSEKVPNDKVQELSDAIGANGVMLTCDQGAMRVYRGTPFAQVARDPDDTIKRRYINIDVMYLTEN